MITAFCIAVRVAVLSWSEGCSFMEASVFHIHLNFQEATYPTILMNMAYFSLRVLSMLSAAQVFCW